MNDEDAIQNILKKIEREKALLNAANAMRAQTNNEAVRSRLDSQMRDGRRNLQFFEEKLREAQLRRGMDNMSLGSPSGDGRPLSGDMDDVPPPPPKDSGWEQRGGYGAGSATSGGNVQYSQIGGHADLMPPRHPYANPGPSSSVPKPRPNFTKLDLIKYDTPYLGPRIQLMLSQIQFKLNVEEQYLKGIEKMVQLYGMEGDRKSRADAAARRVESKQKILLLKQAMKRYEELHIDMDTSDAQDDDSINMPNLRKPLTGQLSIRVGQIKDVDHASMSRFSRGPETFIAVKVEDNVVARTRVTRTDKWEAEYHTIDVDKANEIELTVYDKPGEHAIPIAMLWVRISDIAEEMRRKRIEAEINSSGWVSADRMGAPPAQFPMNPPQQQQSFGAPPPSPGVAQQGAQGQQAPGGMPNPPIAQQPIDGWFNLEPAGQIQLSLGFLKQNNARRPVNLQGLGRVGAVRQRKEEVHEMYGHKFVQHQFYNIMRCALCGDFLKYSTGMQCEDCKYTCHTKCYSSVVTKCISKSNAETDPDEEKINHRIPHRFQAFSNMTANWCCHCGYILPFGKKNCRKCAECGLTAHAACVHLVPDFCGMSMAVANQILEGIKTTRMITKNKTSSSLSDRTLRKPTSPTSTMGSPPHSGGQAPYAGGSPEATEAAKLMYQQQSPPGQRPSHPDRTSSSSAAAAAATAAMSGTMASQPKPQPQDYGQYGGRPGYPPQAEQEDPYSGRKYNPADYAAVNQQAAPYAQQAPVQQQRPVQQQQQPPPQQYQQPPQQQMYQQPPVSSPKLQEPPQISPISSSGGVPSAGRKPLPSATDPGTGQRIGLDHFNFLAVLGKGNFGKVMLAETKRSKRLYAIKVLKKEFIIENDEVESIRSEKRVFLIANRERHPFLTNLHACFQTETRVYFVMEYISGGDLMLHIQRGQFGTKRAQFYAAEVCLALKYFHENGVIYRDLKLDNILLTLDGHIKIADYGLCKEDMWFGSTTSTFCGTPEFMAPEILLDKKYGRAVDWWAFGVLIYQMLLQQSPFRGEDEDEIYDAILADEPLYPIHMPRDSVSILQKLLTREPDQRLGSGPTDAQEIMNQPFFRNINWDDIYHKRVAPPFMPQIKSATDTSNFDSEFTSVTPVLTPVQSVLSQAMQEEFRGFSYTADFD
ncbi:agc pkc protein kinase [Colletotrichum incanum]|uniref:Protein kinase C-like n=1 Tax=Colletotrichum incanum TaxID=1573173 RepID=A0A166ZT12_COLIC|nr:agc pkc protein kinase [Colletotrichum incanum]OHX00481.1 agc pkc protein kinase [Colletotrichum incanum]